MNNLAGFYALARAEGIPITSVFWSGTSPAFHFSPDATPEQILRAGELAATYPFERGIESDWPEELLATVKARLETAPFAGLTDQAAADLLNAKTQRGLIPLWELAIHLIETGIRAKLKAAAATSIAADAAIDYLDCPHVGNLDLDRPVVAGMFAQLAFEGTLTEAEAAGIQALAENRRSYAEIDAIPYVTAQVVADARALEE